MLPTFLVIGAQKSGTKWLFHNLSKHPDIHISSGGGTLEVHYLDSHHYGDVNWWRGHFRPRHGETHLGDITPDYAIVDSRRVRHAHHFCPDAKIIYTLRNPKQRAISHLRMIHTKTANGYQGEPIGPRFLLTGGIEPIVEFFEHGPGFDHGDYGTNIRRWLEVYPPGQVLLLSYDLLQKSPEEYLRRIFAFLGVGEISLDLLPTRDRFHVSHPHPIPQELLPHLDRIFNPVIDDLSSLVDFQTSHWLAPTQA